MPELSKNMRQRVVETLCLLKSADLQRRYQAEAPHVDVSAELFNQWEDCYFPDDGAFQRGFSNEELKVLQGFNAVLERVCRETPQQVPSLEEFMKTEQWARLARGAEAALQAMEEDVGPGGIG